MTHPGVEHGPSTLEANNLSLALQGCERDARKGRTEMKKTRDSNASQC